MLRSMVAVIMSVMDQPFQRAFAASRSYTYWRLTGMRTNRPQLLRHVEAEVKRRYVTYEEVL